METSDGEFRERMASRHGHRRAAVRRRAVAEVAVRVRTPAIDCAAGREPAREADAHVDGLETVPTRYRHGHLAAGHAAVPQLAVDVEAPAEGLTGRGDAAGMMVPGSDLRVHLAAGHRDRHCGVL